MRLPAKNNKVYEKLYYTSARQTFNIFTSILWDCLSDYSIYWLTSSHNYDCYD